MSILVGAIIAALILFWIVSSIFPVSGGVFIAILVAMILFSLPFIAIKGFIRGNIDHAQDRADARADKIIESMDKRKETTFVDARTVSYDNRSITIVGSRPKEKGNGKERRIAPPDAREDGSGYRRSSGPQGFQG